MTLERIGSVKATVIIVFAVSYGIMAALMGAIIWQLVHEKPYGALAVIAVLWVLMLPTVSTKEVT